MTRRAALAAILAACLGAAADAAARRIVSIIPATTEMLFAMGAGDRVVAVGSYDRFPPEVDKLPRVGALLDRDCSVVLWKEPQPVRSARAHARRRDNGFVRNSAPLAPCARAQRSYRVLSDVAIGTLGPIIVGLHLGVSSTARSSRSAGRRR